MMSEPRRLHPIAAVSNVLKTLKDSIIPILIIVVFGNSEGKIQLFITIGIIALILISGILTWLRFTYRIEEGELRIESGLIIRKKDISLSKESKVLIYQKVFYKDLLV